MKFNTTAIRLIVTVVAMGLVGGCAPKITIRHQDPTHPEVRVVLDKENAGQLSYGDEESYSVSEGIHLVELTVDGQSTNPWTEDGRGWTIWVDEAAQLTLLPPVKKALNSKGTSKSESPSSKKSK